MEPKRFQDFSSRDLNRAAKAFTLERLGTLAKMGAYTEADVWDFLEAEERITKEEIEDAEGGHSPELAEFLKKQLMPRIGKAMVRLGEKLLKESFDIKF